MGDHLVSVLEEWGYPIRKDWRYSPGDLIRITHSHNSWCDRAGSSGYIASRVHAGDLLVFLHAYGFNDHFNWKRSMWNLKVISPIHGIVWVPDEYTERVV